MKLTSLSIILATCLGIGHGEQHGLRKRELQSWSQGDPTIIGMQVATALISALPKPYGTILGKLTGYMIQDAEPKVNVFVQIQDQIQELVDASIYQEHLSTKMDNAGVEIKTILQTMQAYETAFSGGATTSAGDKLGNLVEQSLYVQNYLCLTTTDASTCDFTANNQQLLKDNINMLSYGVQFAPLHLNILKEQNNRLSQLNGDPYLQEYATQVLGSAHGYGQYFPWIYSQWESRRDSQITVSVTQNSECRQYAPIDYSCTAYTYRAYLKVTDGAGKYGPISRSISNYDSSLINNMAANVYPALGASIKAYWMKKETDTQTRAMAPVADIDQVATCDMTPNYSWFNVSATQSGEPWEVDVLSYSLKDDTLNKVIDSGYVTYSDYVYTISNGIFGSCVDNSHDLSFTATIEGIVPSNAEVTVTYKNKIQPCQIQYSQTVGAENLYITQQAVINCNKQITGSTMGGSASVSTTSSASALTVAQASPSWWTTFQSVNYNEHYIQSSTTGAQTFINTVDNSNSAVIESAKFRVMPCLAGTTGESFCSSQGFTCVSIESVAHPGYFFRHQNFEIILGQFDYTWEPFATFSDAVSWCVRPGLDNIGSGAISFSSAMTDYKDMFIRHNNYKLYMATNDGSTLFSEDATFQPHVNDASFPSTLGLGLEAPEPLPPQLETPQELDAFATRAPTAAPSEAPTSAAPNMFTFGKTMFILAPLLLISLFLMISIP